MFRPTRQIRRRLALRPERTEGAELLDSPQAVAAPGLIDENLADLELLNRLTGGTWLTLRGLRDLLGDQPARKTLSVLDVATGGADIPKAIARWSLQQHNIVSTITATDVDRTILDLARRRELWVGKGKGEPALHYSVADSRNLPFEDRSFDVVTCSLLLHHLNPEEVIRTLSEMHRVSRIGLVANDLIRSWPGLAGAYLVTRAVSRNPLTRHDGPLSVRRSYTRRELAELAARAGVCPVRFRTIPGYRLALAACSASSTRASEPPGR